MTAVTVPGPGHGGPRAPARPAVDLLHEARGRERAACVPEAIQCYEAAIAAAERAGDHAVLAEALRRLAVVRHHRNESAAARELCRRSYDVACEAANDLMAAEALNTLGGLDLKTGRIDDARAHFLKALERGGHSRELGARVEQNLGILANIQGELGAAVAHYERSLEAYRANNDEHGCAIAYANLGIAHTDLKQYDRADEYLRRGFDIAERAGDATLQGLCLVNHAEVHYVRGRYDEARRNAEAALAIFDQLDTRTEKSEAYRLIGMVYRETGRPAIAESRLRTAIELAVSSGSVLNEAEASVELALLLQGMGPLDETTQTTIRLGAYLHDVGKVRVPHEILNKPGPLTRDEFEVVQMHPIWGLELLAAVEFPWDLKPIIRWHHERYDGTGYPDRLRGDEIPLAAQIVGVVDVYDALTTARSYRPAMSSQAALAEMERCRGSWSAPVYEAFANSLDAVLAPAS